MADLVARPAAAGAPIYSFTGWRTQEHQPRGTRRSSFSALKIGVLAPMLRAGDEERGLRNIRLDDVGVRPGCVRQQQVRQVGVRKKQKNFPAR
jgi:hypothetical protein